MKYIRYKTKGYSGKVVDLLGSDGVTRLDGRYSLQRCILTANDRLKRHIKRRSIVGYEIRTSNNNRYSQSRLIYKSLGL